MSVQADRVMIFDTTLRDGEQSPGCSMTQPEKLRVAKALADLGVDVIEAGFPAASPGDWASVNSVAREVQGPIICGLARCNRDDIEKAARALRDADKHRIHVFLATSAIHRQYKLNMAKEEILRNAVEGVRIAREFCDDVEHLLGMSVGRVDDQHVGMFRGEPEHGSDGVVEGELVGQQRRDVGLRDGRRRQYQQLCVTHCCADVARGQRQRHDAAPLRVFQRDAALLVQGLQGLNVSAPKPHLMALFGKVCGGGIGAVPAAQHCNLHRGNAFHP